MYKIWYVCANEDQLKYIKIIVFECRSRKVI